MTQVTLEEIALMRTNSHPPGAFAILDVLREHKTLATNTGQMAAEWVSRDDLECLTGQRDVRTRISELRRKWGWVIEHNGRAGGASAYRLVDEVRP